MGYLVLVQLAHVATRLDSAPTEIVHHGCAVDLGFVGQLPHPHSGLVLRYEFINLTRLQPSLKLKLFDNKWRADASITSQDRFCQV